MRAVAACLILSCVVGCRLSHPAVVAPDSGHRPEVQYFSPESRKEGLMREIAALSSRLAKVEHTRKGVDPNSHRYRALAIETVQLQTAIAVRVARFRTLPTESPFKLI